MWIVIVIVVVVVLVALGGFGIATLDRKRAQDVTSNVERLEPEEHGTVPADADMSHAEAYDDPNTRTRLGDPQRDPSELDPEPQIPTDADADVERTSRGAHAAEMPSGEVESSRADQEDAETSEISERTESDRTWG
jgi:hypothetical protein